MISSTPPRTPAVEFLPLKLLNDLIENKGKNIPEIKQTLLADLSQQYDRERRKLDDAVVTATVIATGLDQPEGTASRQLAEQLVADYQARRKEEEEFSWSEEHHGSSIADALRKSMEVM